MAPDFALQTTDHSNTVQLSSFRGQKPVVLVFGSYT
jgi:peroxiredoxin